MNIIETIFTEKNSFSPGIQDSTINIEFKSSEKEIIKILNSYNENSTDTRELEIRFGVSASNGSFTPGIVSRQIFNAILDNFNKAFENVNYDKSVDISTYEITRYKNGVRTIVDQQGNIVVEKKNRLDIIDFENLNTRLALSQEEKYNEELPDEYEMKFTRRRTSFFDRKNNVRIDLSENINATQKLIPFEFEVEFLDKKLDINKVYWAVKTFHKIYHKHNSLSTIIRRYNGLFPEIKNKNILYTGGFKPINLKVYNLPYLEDYVFYPKLNGVSYYLYFDNSAIYLVNDTTILFYSKYTADNYKFKGTIILGELMPNGIFYCCDTLTYKRQDVRKMIAVERNNIINNILGKVNNIQKIPMFFSGRDTRKSIENVNNYIQKYFPNPEDNDGILLKHNYTPYNFNKKTDNIFYKWKPEKDLTIDFLVKYDSQYNSDTHTYKIYMGGHNTLIPFTDIEIFPQSGYVNIPIKDFGIVPDGTILEFNFSKNTKKFLPQRIRTDKYNPNYFDTVISTWEDIFYPISMDMIKESSDMILSKKLDKSENLKNIRAFIDKFKHFPRIGKMFDKINKHLSTYFSIDLSCMDLPGIDLEGANLEKADLNNVNLKNANLEWANLIRANIRCANLNEADLQSAKLYEANLGGADLCGAILNYTDFENTDLTWADFTGTDLTLTNLTDAITTNTIFPEGYSP